MGTASFCLPPSGQPVSRILSARFDPAGMIISLGAASPLRSSSLPGTRKRRAAAPPPRGAGEACSCLALLQMGVAWPRHCCRRRWSLTPPFHPHPPRGGRFVSVARSGELLRPGGYPASCPVECGLSSTPPARSRNHPADLRTYILPDPRMCVKY